MGRGMVGPYMIGSLKDRRKKRKVSQIVSYSFHPLLIASTGVSTSNRIELNMTCGYTYINTPRSKLLT